MRLLLLCFLFPHLAFAWTLNDRCELTRETPEGTVAVSRTPSGLLLYLPDFLVANETRVKVGIGSRNWSARVVGGAVELDGAAGPFLAKNWMTVHADGDHLLGLSLLGSSAAWERLADCEPAAGSGGWLALDGEITTDTDDEIIAAIRRQRPEGLVLNSVGGCADEAQRIGFSVRNAGLATKVEAGQECLSECTFILAAGTPRTVERGARVGINPSLVTSGLGVFPGAHGATAETAVFFNAMGVDGGKLAVLATSLTNGDAHIFTSAELRDLGLADTEGPSAIKREKEETAPRADDEDWWWIMGLCGLVAVFWGFSKIWARY